MCLERPWAVCRQKITEFRFGGRASGGLQRTEAFRKTACEAGQ
jgi:hypothetical protein